MQSKLIKIAMILFLGLLSTIIALFIDGIPSPAIVLTVASIFIGYYISLMLAINSKAQTIYSLDVNDSTEREYCKRYLIFLHELQSNTIFALCSISAIFIMYFFKFVFPNFLSPYFYSIFIYYYILISIAVTIDSFCRLFFMNKEDFKISFEKLKSKKFE